jgi:hypothetical protein
VISNGDGKDDIAVTYSGSAHGAGRVALFFQAEDGSTVHSSHQIATDDEPWQVVIGDFSVLAPMVRRSSAGAIKAPVMSRP